MWSEGKALYSKGPGGTSGSPEAKNANAPLSDFIPLGTALPTHMAFDECMANVESFYSCVEVGKSASLVCFGHS